MIEALLSFLYLMFGLLSLTLVGYGFLALLSPGSQGLSRAEQAALSFGVGVLILTLWMLALSALGWRFSLSSTALPPLLTAASGLLAAWNLRARTESRQRDWHTPAPSRLPCWSRLCMVFLVLLFGFAFLRAVLYPMWAWDAVATWGCKAQVFFAKRTLDFTCLEAHNYYPNLVPLLLSYLYLWLGQVNDHLVQGVFPFWGALLLLLLYCLVLRLGLERSRALGVTTFFALNGSVFIIHLYIAYADLPLAYFTLGATGFLYLWLWGESPRGALSLSALCLAGMAWCKYEGPPLAATVILAAALTLLWLRPPGWGWRLGWLGLPILGLILGWLPWRLFALSRHIETGSDHILSFYPHQLAQALPMLAEGLVKVQDFGLLWPAAVLALLVLGRTLWTTPRLFLPLFLGGNLLAILLAYSLAPTSAAEFPQYVQATLNRLLLHITPVTALLTAEGLKDLTSLPVAANIRG